MPQTYIPAVRCLTVLLLIILPLGCASSPPVPRSSADAKLFAPASMRIHPIFTGVKDWTGDGKPDGIEALLEFQDQFNDPTKSAGTVIFELFSYDPHFPDARGVRIVNPWVGSLQTLVDQQARWNRTSRTYFFQLEYPGVRETQNYVLAATFDTGTTRFFDQIVLEGDRTSRGKAAKAEKATTAPTTAPASGPTTMPANTPVLLLPQTITPTTPAATASSPPAPTVVPTLAPTTAPAGRSNPDVTTRP